MEETAQKPISLEEFKEALHKQKEQYYKDALDGILHLNYYNGVGKFKSVRRAMRRGHVSIFGDIYPDRPFNNRKPTKGRQTNELKKKIYGVAKSLEQGGV